MAPPPPLLYRLVAGLARPAVRLAFRPQVTGLERVPPGGIVLAANHLSGFDSVALAMPLYPRWLRNMAKNELFSNPLLAPLLTRLGVFPAHGVSAGGSIARAAEIARGGDVVVILPEGARRRKGRVHAPRTGAARTALAANVALVPAAVAGTDGARRLTPWQVAFGEPIDLRDLQGLHPDVAACRATERLWNAITGLESDLARRRPADGPVRGRRS